MGYLIDTNVLAELRKAAKANQGVLRWFDSVDAPDLYLSALVVGEIRRGIASLERRDKVAAASLEAWLTDLLVAHADQVLPITLPIAECWGQLSVPGLRGSTPSTKCESALLSPLQPNCSQVHAPLWTTAIVRGILHGAARFAGSRS